MNKTIKSIFCILLIAVTGCAQLNQYATQKRLEKYNSPEFR